MAFLLHVLAANNMLIFEQITSWLRAKTIYEKKDSMLFASAINYVTI